MIVTEGQIKMLRSGARLTVESDRRVIVGESYGAQLRPGAKRAMTVTVIAAEKTPTGYRALVIRGDRTDHPRFLKARPGKPGSGSGDYTTREALAMEDEPEPIPEALQARITHTASERDGATRARRARSVPAALQVDLDAARRAERNLLAELDERYQDLTPHEVALHAPHQGDAVQIRERRRRHGRRAIDGRMPLTPEQRAEHEAWLRDTGASIREIARALDCSSRRAYSLWQEWHQENAEAA